MTVIITVLRRLWAMAFGRSEREVFNDLAARDARIARLLSARYLIYGPDWSDPPTAPGWGKIGEPAGGVFWERSDARPRTFIVHDVIGVADSEEALAAMAHPSLTLRRRRWLKWCRSRTVTLNRPMQAHPPHYPQLRTAASCHPCRRRSDRLVGFSTTCFIPVGKRRLTALQPLFNRPTTRYAACVPGGTSEVVFTFQPQILVTGAAVSMIAVVIWIAVVVVWVVQRRRRHRAAAD